MNTTENSKVCGLAEWIPIPTNDSPISVNDLAVAVFNVLSGLFAFLSNLVIIVTAIKTPSLQRPSNILLCSLATADCLTGVTLQPIFVTWRILIQRVHESCSYQQELTTAFDVSSRLMTGWSLVSLAVISCDRCYALSKPFAYRAKVTKGGVVKVAVFTTLTWFATTALSKFVLPPHLGLVLVITSGLLAVILTIINHIAMFMAIRRHNSRVANAVSSHQLLIILGREKRVAKDMFIVTVVLFLCVLPKLVAIVFRQALGNLYSGLYLWSTTAMLLNSCINPVLYLVRGSKLRSAVKSVMHI